MNPDARNILARTLPFLALLLLVGAGWFFGVNRGFGDMLVPTAYGGDAWAVMAQVKAYQAGELVPFLPKDIASLGAPFGASWTDYPAEDLIYWVGGLLAHVVGIEASWALLPALFVLLAGIAFFVTARALAFSMLPAFACAALFALAPFGFTRGLPHLTLTVYSHLPLLLLGLHWVTRAAPAEASSGVRKLAWAGAVLAGWLNPYYLAMYLFLLAVGLVGAWAGGRRAGVAAAGQLIGLSIGAFLLTSLDSVWMTLAHGGNPAAVVRSLQALDLYGLRLPDLVFPSLHRLGAWEGLASAYQQQAPGGGGRGEAATAYLGIVGVLALGMLIVFGTLRIAAQQFERVSPWFWMTLGTLGFAIVGGVNYLLGSVGFVMLRASNRFSIVLLAIALLWLCERLSRTSSPVRWALSILLLAIGLYDQTPPARAAIPAAAVRAQMQADRQFVETIEASVPAGTMVFQLPVKGFPETGPIFGMQDYEHFRPYFFSKTLRFSFGSMKGRGTGDWQNELAALAPDAIGPRLAALGFGVLYVNLHGFPDYGASLRPKLEAALGKPLAESKELLAFKLPPMQGEAQVPRLPPLVTYTGFWPAETDTKLTWAWASRRKASVDIRTPYAPQGYSPFEYKVKFSVDSGFGGAVSVRLDGVEQAIVPPGGARAFELRLPREARHWRLEIESAESPRLPGNGDLRSLGFRLVHLYLSETAPPLPRAPK